MGTLRCSRWALVAALSSTAALAVVAYLPSLGLPFISDDYVQVGLARDYGPVSGWGNLAADALYRCRATSLVLTYWTERLLGLDAFIFNLSSLLLHILNTWLVLALGLWRPIGWRVAAVAAAFFAVYEGHQEAIIWYAALPELLVFFFSLCCLLLWILWLQSYPRRLGLYLGSLFCFVLALLSKESAVVLVALLPLVLLVERNWRLRDALAVTPFAALAVVYAWSIFTAQSEHLHLNDGTFSLHAPFVKTLLNSTFRMFWFWGLLSLLAIAAFRDRQWKRLLLLAAAWIGITFLPYTFLSYMPRVPSRHTYLPSLGLALVVGAGLLTLRERFSVSRRWLPAALAAVILVHNCAYLWTKKQRQFRERAAPTEELIRFVEASEGPVVVECFPYSLDIARFAIELAVNKPPSEVFFAVLEEDISAGRFCFEENNGGRGVNDPLAAAEGGPR